MNTSNFVMTSIVFLIEAGRYEAAAQYIIQDALDDGTLSAGKNGIKPRKRKLVKEIRRKHDSIRKEYPDRLNLEQMREIARKVYEQVFQALRGN